MHAHSNAPSLESSLLITIPHRCKMLMPHASIMPHSKVLNGHLSSAKATRVKHLRMAREGFLASQKTNTVYMFVLFIDMISMYDYVCICMYIIVDI